MRSAWTVILLGRNLNHHGWLEDLELLEEGGWPKMPA